MSVGPADICGGLSVLDRSFISSSLSIRGNLRTNVLSVSNFSNLGSSLSIRQVARFGLSCSVKDLAKLAAIYKLSLISPMALGSSLSVRSFVRLGSSLSITAVAAASYISLSSNFRGFTLSAFDVANLGSTLSVRAASRISGLSLMNSMDLASCISVRSFVRGWGLSAFGPTKGKKHQCACFSVPGIFAIDSRCCQDVRVRSLFLPVLPRQPFLAGILLVWGPLSVSEIALGWAEISVFVTLEDLGALYRSEKLQIFVRCQLQHKRDCLLSLFAIQ